MAASLGIVPGLRVYPETISVVPAKTGLRLSNHYGKTGF